MITVNSFFDKVYLINLDKRKDRLAEATAECLKHNIKFERFSAIEGNPGHTVTYQTLIDKPGHVGCILSHLKIIEIAKKEKLKRILIFEDDIELVESFTEDFDRAVRQLTLPWDMLYLSGNTKKENLVKYTENVYRCLGTLTTHAYAISSSVYAELSAGLAKLSAPIDVFYNRQILPTRQCYMIRPYLCRQRASYSNIVRGFRNYDLK